MRQVDKGQSPAHRHVRLNGAQQNLLLDVDQILTRGQNNALGRLDRQIRGPEIINQQVRRQRQRAIQMLARGRFRLGNIGRPTDDRAQRGDRLGNILIRGAQQGAGLIQ